MSRCWRSTACADAQPLSPPCCSSFATNDAVLSSELQSALEGATSGAAAPHKAACLGVTLVAAAAAVGLLVL